MPSPPDMSKATPGETRQLSLNLLGTIPNTNREGTFS
jgi:hypothetical protein